ncbi:hypothetical protein HPB47_002864 [Ixodes persulcatus]|uniref:Uncharacterized protein n=1 Tax=Ixodes persulcatus TaxID=34615 RepID=A0AC60PK28_IXOPE|nr:hypothetical protein HPB47_002864 [Ixodes persulcatus]
MAASRNDAARRIASFEFAARACDLVFGVSYPLGPSVPRQSLPDRLNSMELYNDRQSLEVSLYEGDGEGTADAAASPLLATLRFYGAGTFHTMTGGLVHVSQPTVCCTLGRVTTLVATVLFKRLVHFPAASEPHAIVRDFYAMGQFPGVASCVGCSHVRIRSPGENDAEVYCSRKGVFSLNVQLVLAQLRFLSMKCGPLAECVVVVLLKKVAAQGVLLLNEGHPHVIFISEAPFPERHASSSLAGPTAYSFRRSTTVARCSTLRILRSESWKQVDRCRNILRIKCHASGVGERTAERDYRRHLKTAAQYTEFFWEQTRPKLVKKTSSRVGGQEEVTVLGDVTLQSKVEECLEHGPKCSQEQRMRPVTQLSLVR